MSLYKDASLVMIPSAYKDGKLYSIRPTDGDGDFTFSRGSNLAATRVDVNGLIEKGRENLFTQSNNFGHSDWNVKAGTFTQGVADPDGGNNAWSWTATNTDPYLYQSGKSTSGVSVLSIWVKGVGSTIGASFQIRTGGAPYKNLTLTGDWQRVEHFNNGTSGTSVGFEYGNPAVVGDVVHIYQAQYEVGLVATDYIETGASTAQAGILEDMPRLDYSGGASCPALLLEPQRSNITAYSEYFAGWTQTNASVTANDIVSPEGVVNGYKLTSTSNGTASRVEIFPSLTDNTIYTGSAFVKKGNVNFAFLTIRPKTAVTESAFFDLENGTITSQGNSPDGATIEEYGNGWYRISLSTNAETGGTTPRFQIAVANTDGSVVTNADEYIYIYGAQLEAGSYPTSYIPTYGASVTRSNDAASLTSVGDLLGDSSGTLFVEVETFEDNAHIVLSDGTLANNFPFRFRITNFQNDMKVDSVSQGNIVVSSTSTNTRYKVASRYSLNDRAVYFDGVLQDTDSTNEVFPEGTLTRIAFDRGDGAANFYGRVYQLAVFPTALTNAELAALTE